MQVERRWRHRDPPRQARQPAEDAVTFAAPLVLLALLALPLLRAGVPQPAARAARGRRRVRVPRAAGRGRAAAPGLAPSPADARVRCSRSRC